MLAIVAAVLFLIALILELVGSSFSIAVAIAGLLFLALELAGVGDRIGGGRFRVGRRLP
ncbi:MAG TPA: hypothetical protein VGH89_10865 [Pseudonocardia sp.]|jgi:hypothetical protein